MNGSTTGDIETQRGGETRFTKIHCTFLVLRNTENNTELRKLRGLDFEALKGGFKGYFSVRLDLHYRLIFSIDKDAVTVTDVLIIEGLANHYH